MEAALAVPSVDEAAAAPCCCSCRPLRCDRAPGTAEADRMCLRAAALMLHDDEGVRDKLVSPQIWARRTGRRNFGDLGSPISPLRLRPAAATPSSSSSLVDPGGTKKRPARRRG